MARAWKALVLFDESTFQVQSATPLASNARKTCFAGQPSSNNVDVDKG
jgi:hypothetical protein